MNTLSNGGNLTRFDLATSLQTKVMQVKGVLVFDHQKSASSDTVITGYSASGRDVYELGAKAFEVPTNVAVRDYVDGTLGLTGGDGASIDSSHADFVHGRQSKLYLGGTISEDNEIGYTVDTGVTASSNNLITSGAVQAHVSAAIDALVDGAPGALDTLNELAASLNDDANLYNTLNTADQQNAAALTAYKGVVGEDLTTDGTLLKTLSDQRAAALAAAVAARDASIATRTGVVDARFDSMDTDLAARAAALVARTASVDQSLADAASARSALDTKIDNEIAARGTAVSAEAATRLAKDNELTAAIAAETTARGVAITAEEDARIAQDTVLEGLITDEASARAAKDTELEASIAAEASTRAAAITALESADAASVVAERATSDAKYHHKLLNAADDSIFASVKVDSAPTAGLAHLVTSAGVFTAIENAKASILNGAPEVLDTLKEIADALGNDGDLAATLTNAISAEVTNRQTAVGAEQSAREAADQNITDNLAQEVTDRIAAVSAEATARATAITAESTARATAITAEESARIAKDNEHDTALADRYTKAEVDALLLNIAGAVSITLANGTVIQSGDSAVTVPAAGGGGGDASGDGGDASGDGGGEEAPAGTVVTIDDPWPQGSNLVGSTNPEKTYRSEWVNVTNLTTDLTKVTITGASVWGAYSTALHNALAGTANHKVIAGSNGPVPDFDNSGGQPFDSPFIAQSPDDSRFWTIGTCLHEVSTGNAKNVSGGQLELRVDGEWIQMKTWQGRNAPAATWQDLVGLYFPNHATGWTHAQFGFASIEFTIAP